MTETIRLGGFARSRRDFIRWGWSLGAGLVLPAGFAGCGGGNGNGSSNVARRLHDETFVEPPTLESRNGLLDVTLEVAYRETTLAGKPVRLRSLGNSLPAPTLRVQPGDLLRIRLANNLPPNARSVEPVRHLRYPNSTNLHTHGLHVTPGLVSAGVYGDYVMDDPALGVQPGQSRQHEFRIRADHPPGACWYHPHLHGATAIQVGSGMAGALIIRGEIDRIPEIAAAVERVFVFQAPITDDDGVLESFVQVTDRPFNELSFLVNGVQRPRLVMHTGEVQNWRFVHAGIFNFLNLVLDGHTLHVHGHDGLPRAQMLAIGAETVDGLVLAPGNRASVLVQAGAPGTYYLRTLGPLADILAEVVVIEEPRPMALPAGPLPVPALLAPITDEELASGGGLQRHIVLRQIFNPDGSPVTAAPANAVVRPGDELADWVFQTGNTAIADNVFAIGAAGISATGVPALPGEFVPFQSVRAAKQTVPLNSVEEWTVYNMNAISHPFHLHVYPFQVVKVNGRRIDPYWADTVALPPDGSPTDPTSITFRTRFVNFDGAFVMHCHMLVHEDMGMMQTVEVVA